MSYKLGLNTFWVALIFWASPTANPSQCKAKETLDGYTVEFPAMGSKFEIAIYAHRESDVIEAVGKIENEVTRLNSIFSDYDPTSELQRLIQSEVFAEVPVSLDLFSILTQARNYSKRSDGAFDVTVGSLTHLWRAARKRQQLPTKDSVDLALQKIGWNKIQLNESNSSVVLQSPDLQIDFGGIATGYTVDRCAEMLIAADLPHFMINSGGDIRCGKAPPGRNGWRIEVAPIDIDAPPIRYLLIHDCSITTSGDLWQSIEVDGVRRSHIVDPRTGYGIPGPMAVTVIAKHCLSVDVLATTLSVMGPEKGFEFLETFAAESIEAMFVWRDQKTDSLHFSSSAGFASKGQRTER